MYSFCTSRDIQGELNIHDQIQQRGFSMYELYHDLTPEETVSISDLLLKIARRIGGSSYVDDLSIRIEREKSVLKRSLAMARQSEFARLLAEADSHFVHALTVFQDLVEVKSRIDCDPVEQTHASTVYAIVRDHIVDPVFSSRELLLESVEQMVSLLDQDSILSGMVRLGILPLFNDLKSKFRLYRELEPPFVIFTSMLPVIHESAIASIANFLVKSNVF